MQFCSSLDGVVLTCFGGSTAGAGTNEPSAMTPLTRDRLDGAALTELLAELGREARERRFDVAPNPAVGAAVLSGTRVVARGAHEVFGGAHAEVVALERAALSGVPASEWDTLVCTLEPCSSHGRTGPCTERILASGIRRVVVGALDPDPRHKGRGLTLLRDAGLEVELLPGVAGLETVSAHFVRWMAPDRLRLPRPWTLAKWAQTRTGQLTPPQEIGAGRLISSPASQAEVQVLRGRVDAIVTGIGTVLADDPRLSVRPPGDPSRPPIRVVLDSYLKTPPDARLFDAPGPGEGAGPVYVLCLAGPDGPRHRALEAAGARVVGLHASPDDRVRLWDVQTWLWEQGVRRVLLEAGPTLLQRYFELGFVDQVRIYSGSVNGGRGPSLGSRLSGLALEERIDREVGDDSVIDAFARPER